MENITLNTFVSDLKLEPQEIKFLHKLDVFKVYEFLLLNNLSKELADLNASLSIAASLLNYQNTTLKLIETESTPAVISDEHVKIWNYILSRFSKNTKSYLKTMSINSLADFVSFDFESSSATQNSAKESLQEINLIKDKLKRMNLVSEQKQEKTERTGDIKGAETTKAVSEQKKVEVDRKLSQEQFKVNDTVMLDMVRNQLGNKGKILDKLKIQTYDQLRKQSEDEFSYMLGAGSIMAIHIQNAMSVVESKVINTTSNKLEYKSLKDFPLWTGIPILNNDIPAKFKPDVNVFDFINEARCVNVLKSLDLNTIADLLMTSYVKVLSLPSIGPNTLDKLRKDIVCFINYEPVESENLNFGKSFSDFISMLCLMIDVSEKHTNILLELLCGDHKRAFTRVEVGDKYSCSRERIRQILTLRVDQIKLSYNTKQYINRLNTVLLEALNAAGGVIDFDELSSRIAAKMNWNDSLKGYMLGQYVKSFSLDKGEKVVGDVLSIQSPFRDNKDITCKLNGLVGSTDKVSFDSIRETLNLYSKSLNIAENSSNREINFSKALIIEYAEKLKLKYDTNNVYGLRLWRLKNGGLHKKVETILFSTLRPMTHQEVSDILNKKLNTEYYDKYKIYKALICAPGCVLWGNNEFVHSSIATCSDDTLNIISSTLSEKLKKAPLVLVKSIYDEFADIFKKDKIPNKYALGAVISLRLPEYYIERYRYVYTQKPKNSGSVNNITEKWIRSAGKPVSRRDLENYLHSKVGTKTNSVYTYLSSIPTVITNASDYFIHVDNINLKKDNLLELQEYISKELKLSDQIGVNKVFAEYQEYLSQYQISDSKVLYGVLRNYCSDNFSFPIFPHIRPFDKKKIISLTKILSDFILEKGTIVSKNDFDKYFEQIGYIDLQTRSRIAGEPSILEYSKDSIVHKNTINWNESKMTNLLQLLTNAYSDDISSGALSGDLKKFFATYKKHLPLLDNNIKWTERLFNSIVSQMSEVLILGNAKRAYIIKEISNILSLEDMVYYVVKNCFDGKCSREELNQWMKDNGVVRNSITTKMFSNYKKLIVNENEIYME